jgi:VIT1/CCC1 family predicted Fe2+/Mn2+ transporter
MGALTDAIGSRGALLVSVVLAVAVMAALWFLSRTERRDRRRVLGTLAGYGVASVGLSAISASVSASWVVTATFVEESGEALAGVAFFIAVLVGVAPRLVLPAAWSLRREVDAHTLDLPEQVPGRTFGGTAHS